MFVSYLHLNIMPYMDFHVLSCFALWRVVEVFG